MNDSVIGAVTIFVSDQDRSIEFFCGKVGLEIANDYRRADFRWVSVRPRPGDTELILYRPVEPVNGEQFEDLRGRIGIWTGIVFLTDDIQETYRLWRKRGVNFESAPEWRPWGGWEARFRDPDGNEFHLAQRLRPQGRV